MSRRRDFQSIRDSNLSSGHRRCPHHALPTSQPVMVAEDVQAASDSSDIANTGKNQVRFTVEENSRRPVHYSQVAGNKGPSVIEANRRSPVSDLSAAEQNQAAKVAAGMFQSGRPVDTPPSENKRRQVSNTTTKGRCRCRCHNSTITEETRSLSVSEGYPQITDAIPDPPANERMQASSPLEGHRRHSVPDLPTTTAQSQSPYTIEENLAFKVLPASTNKIVLQIDGTRIFQTTNPSIALYQLSHPLTRKSDDEFEGLTLSTTSQLSYIPSKFAGPYRICDMQILDKDYSHHDPYPQVLIQSPPWGLQPPLLKFFYKENGRVMGICETDEACEQRKGHNRHHPPSLLLAAGIFETENAVERPKLDYPKGEYRVQWLQCRSERVTAVEMCDLVEGDNGRLKRRYRIAWNRTKMPFKEEVDLLVASWCTRVWMEEVYMKAMRIAMKEFVKERALRSFRFRMKRARHKVRRTPGRICSCRRHSTSQHFSYYSE